METDTGGINSADMILAGGTTKIAVFMCPSQPGGDLTFSGQEGQQPSNYNGNIGTNVYNAGDCDGLNPLCTRLDGIFFVNSRIGLRDITDGASNTFLVMEVPCQLNASMPGGERFYNFSAGAAGIHPAHRGNT